VQSGRGSLIWACLLSEMAGQQVDKVEVGKRRGRAGPNFRGLGGAAWPREGPPARFQWVQCVGVWIERSGGKGRLVDLEKQCQIPPVSAAR
jgi:hypothetical protein